MNPHELRLGNYLLDSEGNLINIGSLQDNFHGRTINRQDVDDFKAIPLTEELLLKAGFGVKDDNPKQKPHYEGDILFNILDFEFSNSEKGDDGGFYCYEINGGNTVLKYVHQLQNLYFALTGEELTIKELTNQ